MAARTLIATSVLCVTASAFLTAQTPGRRNSPPAQSAKREIKTPLTSVEAVTDIDAPRDPDDPGTGGGADFAGYFSRRLAAKIGSCTVRVRLAADNWAKANRLIVSKSDQKGGDLLLHVGNADLDGFFELTYRIRVQQERARVTLFFYSAEGIRHEPTGIKQLLDQFHVAGFQDELTKAILCGDK